MINFGIMVVSNKSKVDRDAFTLDDYKDASFIIALLVNTLYLYLISDFLRILMTNLIIWIYEKYIKKKEDDVLGGINSIRSIRLSRGSQEGQTQKVEEGDPVDNFRISGKIQTKNFDSHNMQFNSFRKKKKNHIMPAPIKISKNQENNKASVLTQVQEKDHKKSKFFTENEYCETSERGIINTDRTRVSDYDNSEKPKNFDFCTSIIKNKGPNIYMNSEQDIPKINSRGYLDSNDPYTNNDTETLHNISLLNKKLANKISMNISSNNQIAEDFTEGNISLNDKKFQYGETQKKTIRISKPPSMQWKNYRGNLLRGENIKRKNSNF